MYRIKVGNEQKNNLYGWAETPEEANKIIYEYIKKQEKGGFKSYYTTYAHYEKENLFIIDYGSHINFIYLSYDTEEEGTKYLNA